MAEQEKDNREQRGGAPTATGAVDTEKDGVVNTHTTGNQDPAPTGSTDFDRGEGFDRSDADRKEREKSGSLDKGLTDASNPGKIDTTGGGITTGGTQ